MKKKLFALALLFGAIFVVGCSGSEPSADDAASALKGAKTPDGTNANTSGGTGTPEVPK